MSRTLPRLMLFFLLLFAASCSSSVYESTTTVHHPSDAQGEIPDATVETTSAATAAPGDPCGFVSDAQMSEILGQEVTAVMVDPTTCDYGSAAGTGGISLTVEHATGSGCEPVFAIAGYGSDGGEPVDGVGTYARFGGGFVPQLAVCFDDELTLIASLGAESANPRATLTEVAISFRSNIS